MTINSVRRSSNGRGQLIAGVVLLAIGVVGVVLYATGVTGELSEGGSDGAAQGATIWGAALFIGAGAVLVVLGVIRRRRRSSNADERVQR